LGGRNRCGPSLTTTALCPASLSVRASRQPSTSARFARSAGARTAEGRAEPSATAPEPRRPRRPRLGPRCGGCSSPSESGRHTYTAGLGTMRGLNRWLMTSRAGAAACLRRSVGLRCRLSRGSVWASVLIGPALTAVGGRHPRFYRACGRPRRARNGGGHDQAPRDTQIDPRDHAHGCEGLTGGCPPMRVRSLMYVCTWRGFTDTRAPPEWKPWIVFRIAMVVAVVTLIAVGVSSCGSSSRSWGSPTTGRLTLKPCTVQGVPARCGTFVVPENRLKPNGRTIGLRVVVLPALLRPVANDAVTYLAGRAGRCRHR
jgi:hypothetical protein